MRTTISLDDALLKDAKALANRTGRTLTAVIEDALREALSRVQNDGPVQPIVLPTFGGRGLQPGVDLDDSAALLELMEQNPGPA